MTTIIERPTGGDDGGTAIIALIVGALAALVFGLYAFGAFEAAPTRTVGDSTSITVETPAPAQPAQPSTEPAPAQPPAQ